MDRDALHKKTYTNWANYCLRNTKPRVKITDIEKELPDGVTLIKLLEVLTENVDEIKKLNYRKDPANVFQVRANLEEAFKFMKEKDHVRIVFIGAYNLEGHTLALMWSLILHYHFGITDSSGGQNISTAKRLLLAWLDATLPEIKITNFSTNWTDGHNLVALINKMEPQLITGTWDTPLERVTEAMKVASEKFEIPQIIQPEDFVNNADELSTVSYLYYFCNKQSVGRNALLKWIQEKIPQCNITNFTTDWKDGIALAILANVISQGQFPEHKDMTPADPLSNVTKTMKFAADTLGISQITTPKKFIDPKLDQLVTMTYLTDFKYARVPEPEIPLTPTINPSKCQAIGNGLQYCILGEVSRFSVSNCGDEKLQVQIQGPTSSVSANTEKTMREGTYTVQYCPNEVGQYTINVHIMGQHINGSPFTCKCIDPNKCIIERSDKASIVGQPISFQISTLDAGEVIVGDEELQVQIQGPTSSVSANTEKTTHEGTYTVEYCPNEVGLYTINVHIMGQHINGSPFACKCIDPNKCTIERSDKASIVGQPISFQISTLDAGEVIVGDEELQVQIQGPTSSVSANTEKTTHEGTYTVEYCPNEVGLYTINVHIMGQHINGSPFVCKCIDPNKCIIERSDKASIVGQPISFQISTLDAGEVIVGDEELQVQIQGPTSSVSANTEKTTHEGTYTVEYCPNEVGLYTINVHIMSQHINGSPFACKCIDPNKCTIERSDKASIVGQPISFQISTLDAGEVIVGDEELQVQIQGPTSSVSANTEKTTHEGTYTVEYCPNEVGLYTINVHIMGQHINGSPFACKCIDPNKCTIERSDKASIVGQPISFQISTLDAGEVIVGDEELQVQIQGPTSSVSANTEKTTHEGTYTVEYCPNEVGLYTINVHIMGQHINGSPFTCKCIDPNKCTIDRSDKTAIVGQPISFQISTLDAGEVIVGDEELQVEIQGPTSSVSTNTEKTTHEGTYTVEYCPNEVGLYTINLHIMGQHINGSPFVRKCIDPNKCIIERSDKTAIVCHPISFQISMLDAGEVILGDEELQIQIQGPTSSVSANTEKTTHEGTYTVEYCPNEIGLYTINVHIMGQHINGSPFVCKCIDPNKCIIERSDKPAIVGHPISFQISTLDAGEVIVGDEELQVQIQGPTSSVSANTEKTTHEGTYTVEYCPNEVGLYTINVHIMGQHINGSPFACKCIDPNKCTIERSDKTAIVGHPISFQISTLDAGEVILGDEELQIQIQGPTSSVSANTEKTTHEGTYTVEYCPNEVGLYTINLHIMGQHINGSPFVRKCIDPNKCIIERSDKTAIVCHPISFQISTLDAGEVILGDEELQIQIQGPTSSVSANTEKTTHEGTYTVEYCPNEVGLYTINVHIMGQHINGSPFVCKCIDPNKCTIERSDKASIVGHPISFQISTLDAGEVIVGDEELQVQIQGPTSSVSANTEKTTHEGTYTVEYCPNEVGLYTINVHIMGQHINGSPFACKCIDPNKCTIERSDKTAIVGHPISFQISTLDAGEVIVGDEELQVQIQGPTSSVSTNTEKTTHEGTYTVEYCPNEVGLYTINLHIMGQHINGSPFVRKCIDPNKCIIERSNKTAIVGHPISFQISTLDAGEVILGDEELQVQIQGPTSSVSANTEKTMHEGTYTVEYCPNEVGLYTINVHIMGQHIIGSPFACKCIDPNKCIIKRSNKTAIVGHSISFQISTLDAGEGELFITAKKQNESTPLATVKYQSGGSYLWSFTPKDDGLHSIESKFEGIHVTGSPLSLLVASCSAYQLPKGFLRVSKEASFMLDIFNGDIDNLIATCNNSKDNCQIDLIKDNTYKVSFVPDEVGTLVVNVTYANHLIPGSPFQFSVNDPSKCTIDIQPSTTYVVNEPITIPVSTTLAGKGKVTAEINGNKALEVSDTFIVKFIPKEERIFHVNVFFDGEKITKTPLELVVKNRRKGVEHIIVTPPTGDSFVINSFILYKVDATNTNHGGTLKGTCIGLNHLHSVSVDIINEGDQQYTLIFFVDVPDEYQVNILWNDHHVPGSPFRVSVKKSIPEPPTNPEPVDVENTNNLPLLGVFGLLYIFLWAHESLY